MNQMRHQRGQSETNHSNNRNKNIEVCEVMYAHEYKPKLNQDMNKNKKGDVI